MRGRHSTKKQKAMELRKRRADPRIVALRQLMRAYYNGSDLLDKTGNSKTLTNNNGVTFTAGNVGNAYTFASASNQWLSRTNEAIYQGGADLSIVGCFKLTSTLIPSYVVSNWLHNVTGNLSYVLDISFTADPRLFYSTNGSNVLTLSSNHAISVDECVKFAIRYDHAGTSLKLRINSTEVEASTTLNAGTVNPFRVGSADNSGRFNGQIDEVGVADLLTDQQVQDFFDLLDEGKGLWIT